MAPVIFASQNSFLFFPETMNEWSATLPLKRAAAPQGLQGCVENEA